MPDFELQLDMQQKPYYSEEGYDRLAFAEGSEGFMLAAIDGMGVSPESERVANEVKEHLEKMTQAGKIYNFKSIAQALDNLIADYISHPTNGGATATAIFIDSHGDIHYAHIGDSRLYCMKDRRAWQVTADEGIENILYNYVGSRSRGVCQVGIIGGKTWETLILTTDGVTGDRVPDLLTLKQVEEAMNLPKVDAVSNRLMAIATKRDDRSVAVVRKVAVSEE